MKRFNVMIFLVLFLFPFSIGFQFTGEKFWQQEDRTICDKDATDFMRSDTVCFVYFYFFHTVKIEIIRWEPALVIYRDLLSDNHISGFMKTFREKEREEMTVFSSKGTIERLENRQANGSFLIPEDSESIKSVFSELRKSIPIINFDYTEFFNALSYFPGGHYAPHYDFLMHENEDSYDWWMYNYRNRIATLIIVLQPAEIGGATIFPYLETSVKPNSGDAFLWFNAKSDESVEEFSFHGGCPVYKGEKVIATMWIRARDQPILTIANPERSIPAELLFPDPFSPIRLDYHQFWDE